MKTLLLNASYEPLTVVRWQRAITLVMEGEAEVVHEYEDNPITTPSGEVGRPSVIRMIKYVKVPYRTTVPFRRGGVLARDKYVCQFSHCNRKGDTIDHVVPQSDGGEDSWTNCVAACQKCNAKKANKSMKQMGWKLKREPVAPHGRYLLIGMKPRPEWEQYLEATT